jgi:AcrR family transcriptional regulator
VAVSKGDETRVAILDEALQLASTVGFTGLSIGQLAEHTRMSKSGLFAHFRSKEQLQLQALAHARDRFTDLVVRPALDAPRGEPRVRELFERWLAWQRDALTGGCIFVAATAEYDDQPGPMRDAVARDQADWVEFIAHAARSAVAEGHFRDDLDADQFAFQLLSLMLGLHHLGRLLHDPRALERCRTAVEELIAGARAG